MLQFILIVFTLALLFNLFMVGRVLENFYFFMKKLRDGIEGKKK